MEPVAEPPFVAEVYAVGSEPNRFEPACRVRLGTGFRRLASRISPDCLRDLTILLSFATANGRISPSAADLSGGLGVPVWRARLRLFRLALTHWEGQPLVRVLRHPNGLVTFPPSDTVCGRQELPTAAALVSAAPARGDVVRAVSRARYSRPRAEVEREILAHQGWPSPEEMAAAAAGHGKMPEDIDGIWAVNRLMKAGIDYSLALRLLREFGADRCLRQCAWLEYRGGSVKNKRRFLVAAIRGDYAKPATAPDTAPTPTPDTVSPRSQAE